MDENICDIGKQIEELFDALSYDTKENLNMYKSDETYQKIEQFYDLDNSFLDSTNRKFFSNFIFGNATKQSFLKVLQERFDELCTIEMGENHLTESEVKFQLNLSITFAKHFETNNQLNGICENPKLLNGNSDCPLYEVLLNFYSLLGNSIQSIGVVFDKRRAFFWEKFCIFLGGSFKLNLNHTQRFEDFNINTYSTMIITASSDLDSASDVLVQSFNENSLPWKIRNVLVQESISDNFFQLVQSKVGTFSSNYLTDKNFVRQTEVAVTKATEIGLRMIRNKENTSVVTPTVVIGLSRKYFDDIPNKIIPAIVVANIFRTAKEAVSLFNSFPSPAVAIWSEHHSTTYEMINELNASLIWINCHKNLIPTPLVYLREICNHSVTQISETQEHFDKFQTDVVQKLSSVLIEGKTHQQVIQERGMTPVTYDKESKYFKRILDYHGEKLIQLICTDCPAGAGEYLTVNYKIVVTRFGVTFGN